MEQIKFSENGENLLKKEKKRKKKFKVKRKFNYRKILEATGDLVELIIDILDL